MPYPSYEQILNKRRIWYKSVESIYCPALKEKVVFNARGFHHLLYDGSGRARSREERLHRLKLLHCAPIVIRNATNIFENRKNGRIEYWSLRNEGKEDSIVTIILRRIGTGKIGFYSIWSTYGEIKTPSR